MANFELLVGPWLDQELGTADSTVLFTSTRRAQAINDGAQEFADLTECGLVARTVICSCNVSEYDLLASTTLGSTDFLRLAPRGVEFHFTDSNGFLTQIAGDDFPRRDIEVLNREDPGWRQSTTPGMPTGYYVDLANGHCRLGLDVHPSVGSSETAVLIVPYIARPPYMTSTGDMPWTFSGNVRTDLFPFHRACAHYAAYLLQDGLRGDEQAADRQLAKFMNYVNRYSEKFKNKGTNFVRLARNYLRESSRGRRSGSGVNGAWDPRRDFD